MSKLKNKKTSVPNPYSDTGHNTEWTVAAKLAEWINEIAKEYRIDIGLAEVEKSSNRKRSDIQIYEAPGSNTIMCLIECKQPQWDVYSEELKQDALHKSQHRKAKYFCTSNFRDLVWWKTAEANDPTLTEADQIVEKYALSEIFDLDQIEQTRFKEPTKKQNSVKEYDIFF